jgi:hypothetical protein
MINHINSDGTRNYAADMTALTDRLGISLVNYLIGTLAADSGIQSSATAAVLSNKDN